MEQSIIPGSEMSQTASKQDMTVESQTKVQMEPWLLNNKKVADKKQT